MIFFHFVPPSFESPRHALFRLVFTVAITKKIVRSQNTAHSTYHQLSTCHVALTQKFVIFFLEIEWSGILSQFEYIVLSKYEILHFLTIWVFEFSHSLGFVAIFIFWVIIFSVFEFGGNLSFSVVTFWMFEFCHYFSFCVVMI